MLIGYVRVTDPDKITDVQRAFMEGMTDQRVANTWEAADFIADLSPETKEFLRKADKQKIEQLDATLKFMNATGIIWKFLLAGGVTIFGFVKAWEWLSQFFTVKLK